MFVFTPERFSRSPRNPFRLAPEWRSESFAEEVYFYGIDGQKLGVHSILNGTSATHLPMIYLGATRLNAYFAGKLVARTAPIGGGGTITFDSTTPDRIGSLGKYYPYGEERGTITANDQEKFATYTRDSASGLDYAMNRYYSNTQARFMSPDPYRASGGTTDPGSWNRYAYVGGDPINRYDPSGLYGQAIPGCRPGSGGGGECGSAPSGQSSGWIPFEDPSHPDPIIGKGPNPTVGTGHGQGGGGTTGSWATTLSDLQNAASFISTNEDMWNIPACAAALGSIGNYLPDGQRVEGSPSPTLGNIIAAASSVTFLNSSSFPSPWPSGAYAESQYYSNLQWWVPGSTTLDPSPSASGGHAPMTQGRLNGMVLHELLHNLGYSDNDIQRSLGIPVIDGTDNISRELTNKCFP